MKKIRAGELEDYFNSFRPKKVPVLIYTDIKRAKIVERYGELHIEHLRYIDTLSKETTILFTVEPLKVAGWDIEQLEVEYPVYLRHAKIKEKGVYHIVKYENGEPSILCNKDFDVLHYEQDYCGWNKLIDGVCSKCEEQYQFYKQMEGYSDNR